MDEVSNIYTCGLIIRCSAEGFKDIKDFIASSGKAKIIYQRTSFGHLKIIPMLEEVATNDAQS